MTAAFSAPLLTMYDHAASKALGGDFWRVCKSFEFVTANGRRIQVPAGYLTDGASVPRAAWSFIPPWGKYGQAAVTHDLLCEYLSLSVDGKPTSITRAECDAILLEAMQALGVDNGTAKIISDAVDLYRVFSHTDKPTATPEKRALESAWTPVF